MPTLKTKHGQARVSATRVSRMADRMHKLTDKTIRLLGDGVYYVPLIQMLLSRHRMDQLLETIASAAASKLTAS